MHKTETQNQNIFIAIVVVGLIVLAVMFMQNNAGNKSAQGLKTPPVPVGTSVSE